MNGRCTVTFDVGKAVREVKAGKIEFRVDKGGNVHAAIGKVSFPLESLQTNFAAFTDAIIKARPAGAKGKFVKKVSLTSSMGPGLKIDVSEVEGAGA